MRTTQGSNDHVLDRLLLVVAQVVHERAGVDEIEGTVAGQRFTSIVIEHLEVRALDRFQEPWAPRQQARQGVILHAEVQEATGCPACRSRR